MKKFMLTILCFAMVLSAVSCDDGGDDEDKKGVNLVIWNDTGYYVSVSVASVGSYDIIDNLWSGNDLILMDEQVYMGGTPDADGSGISSASYVYLPYSGTFAATYQVQDDSDGNPVNTDAATLPYVDISGTIDAEYTLEPGKTYLVYFCSLTEDTDGTDDYFMAYEVGDSWERTDMTLITGSSSCSDTSGGTCP